MRKAEAAKRVKGLSALSSRALMIES